MKNHRMMGRNTPTPHAVRLAGTLDTISASCSDVILALDDGTKLPARLEDHDADVLRQLFGSRVVISGLAHYRPSGRLLLVDVETIEPARDTDRIFGAVSIARRRVPVFSPIEQDEASGVSAFFGVWPGDESEEDLLAALQAIE